MSYMVKAWIAGWRVFKREVRWSREVLTSVIIDMIIIIMIITCIPPG